MCRSRRTILEPKRSSALWERLLPATAARVRPDLLIVSAGFDYVRGDPAGDLGVEVEAASHLGALIERVANEYCGGRVAYVLEGGYDLDALSRSVHAIIEAHDAPQTREPSGAEGSAIPGPQRELLETIEALD